MGRMAAMSLLAVTGFLAAFLQVSASVGQEPIRVRVAGRTLDQWSADTKSPAQTTRLRAAKSVGLFGKSATSVFVAMLADRDDAVRYWAASHLGDLDQLDAPSRVALLARQDDPSAGVRLAVSYALSRGNSMTRGKDIAPLLEGLASRERGAACASAEFLGRLGTDGELSIERLKKTLARHSAQGGDYHVRGAVTNAIRKISQDDSLANHKRPKKGGSMRVWSRRPNKPRPAEARRPTIVDRPNILWISCEDISANLGCYGDRYALTPHLDRLASQGARYTRAFTPAGVCAVVRSGLITGMYPISIGSQHMRSRIVPPPEVKCFPEYLRAAGYFCTNKSKTDYQFDPPITAWDRQGNNHDDWRARAPGQRFFSVINLTISHESQIRHSEEVHDKLLQGLEPAQRHSPAAAAEHLPPIYPKTPEALKDWAWYHDNISEMDRQVGQILARLEEDNLADNTVVVFWSDHGRGLPRGKRWVYDSGVHIPMLIRWPGELEPGSVVDEFVSTQDLSPTTLAIAGLDPPSYMHGRIMAGPSSESPPKYLFFHRDRMDEAFDLMRAARDERFKYIRNYEPEKPYSQHIDYMDHMPTLVDLRRLHREGALRGAETAFMKPNKPVEELYDVVADPHETQNLAGDPKHADTLVKMREAVEQWQNAVGDLGLVPEPILMERMRPGGVMVETAQPAVSVSRLENRRRVALSCETDGASIAYAIGDSKHWRLYHRPFSIEPGEVVRAKSIRLGYSESRLVRQVVP
jgi:N-sulfoglucosamine sulfohydrolase